LRAKARDLSFTDDGGGPLAQGESEQASCRVKSADQTIAARSVAA
jgi:hypothetical protein